jgi:hypothetical protein
VSWGVGNSDVHEIEKGISHITLHQPATSMLVSMRSNTRKRTGPDSSPAEYPVTPTPLNVSRDDQSLNDPGLGLLHHQGGLWGLFVAI